MNDNDGRDAIFKTRDPDLSIAAIYLQTPSPVHSPHKIAEETRRNMTPEKKHR